MEISGWNGYGCRQSPRQLVRYAPDPICARSSEAASPPRRCGRPAEPREVVGKAPGGHAPEAGEERLERGVQGVDAVERGARAGGGEPLVDARGKTGTSVTGRQGGRQDMDTTHRDLERDIDRIDAMLHADEAPRGRRAAKSGGSEDESGRKAAAARIEVIDLGEVDGLGIEDKDVLRTLRELATSHSTFAEAYAGCFAGSVYLPEAPGATRKRVRFGFYLDAARLALLGIDGAYSGTAEGALTDDLSSYPSAPRALYELLRHLIREDFLRLVDVEGELSDIEERIIAAPSRLRGEDGRILRRRRELMRLNGAYQQLDELASTIAQDDDGLLPRTDRRLFNTLSQQAQRLSAKAQYLREYCVQLIELKDARADARRDATNLYLTVVASIFVPITTITGWYGMNFSNMPELSWEYGYATVIALSLVIIAAELAFFKWKKWL